jgi:lipoprotein-anchoring transpeptidase ErfK/SrfK
VLAGVGGGAVVLTGPGDARRPPAPAVSAAGLHAAPAPALRVRPVARPASRHATRWQAVRRAMAARARPSSRARRVGWLPVRTPEATTNVVLPLARARDRRGGLWVRVALPALPNGRTGWVPRRALGATGTVTTRLVVDLGRRTATLRRDGRRVLRVPVGIGTPAAPTPRGRFVVRDRLTRYHSSFYGPVAFGTSARSPTLTDWPAGGFIGIHGTDRPDLIPGAVSHGCIRLRDADVRRLARLLPVGTPLTIR